MRKNWMYVLLPAALVLVLYAVMAGTGIGPSESLTGQSTVSKEADLYGDGSEEGTGAGVEESETETEADFSVTDLAEADTGAEIRVQEDLDFHRDGKYYQKVPDLTDGAYYWASAVTEGSIVKDEHGCEYIDHDSQSRSFERLDGTRKLGVRRWDNLLYSSGEYLIYEYDGVVQVAQSDNLYHPVLTYDVAGTHGLMIRVPDGYMVANEKTYTVTFYDGDFQQVRQVEGYRAGESGDLRDCFPDSHMPVRDMETGLMGFMDPSGDLAVPCRYGAVSAFSNGYASVLVDAKIIPYTEDQGTVKMFDAQGGRWGIIDTDGNFVVEPSDRFENTVSEYYGGGRRFSQVREDKTVDFINVEEDRVIETIRIER